VAGSETIARKLAALLASDAAERQIAAAIVAGELGVRDPAVVDGLLALVASGLAPLQRHAVEALARLGARKAVPRLLPLLAARDEGVRRATVEALAGFGAAALPALRARLAAAEGDERRVLEEALARLGGKEAFAALLASLETTDAETARAASLAVRQRIKEASPRERRAYLAEVKRFLALKKTQASLPALLAGIRILGFLENDAAAPLLLGYATSARQPPELREEAVVALRFLCRAGRAASPRAQAATTEKLLAVAESAPVAVARAALYTLAGLVVPPAQARRLGKLAAHQEGERALLAIERLAQLPGAEAAEALGRVLLETGERARAEAAASALAARPEAGATLARALLAAGDDADRANMLAKLLRPHLRALDARLARALRDAAVARLAEGRPGWQPLLAAAREADAPAAAAALRAAADKLRKARKHERALEALRALGRTADAAPEDGYALGALELVHGSRDEALVVFGQLLDRGFDLGAALARDRTLDLERRYQIGFHLAERHHPAADEILAAVAEAGGRSNSGNNKKIAQMARAKLRSAARAG
jgi:hypothetical protein